MSKTIYFTNNRNGIEVQVIDNPDTQKIIAYCGSRAYVQAATFTGRTWAPLEGKFTVDGYNHYVEIVLPLVGFKKTRTWITFISENFMHTEFSSKPETENKCKINPVLTSDGIMDITVNITYKYKFIDSMVAEINHSRSNVDILIEKMNNQMREAVAKSVGNATNENYKEVLSRLLPSDSYINIISASILFEPSRASIDNAATMITTAKQAAFDAKIAAVKAFIANGGVFDMDGLNAVLDLLDGVAKVAATPPRNQCSFGSAGNNPLTITFESEDNK